MLIKTSTGIVFELEARGYQFADHIVSWSDPEANRRYHVWVYGGKLDDTIHSNWIDDKGKTYFQTHRNLSQSTQWAKPIVAAIRNEVISQGRLEQATREAKAEDARAEAQEKAERAAIYLHKLISYGHTIKDPVHRATLMSFARIATDDEILGLAIALAR